ncbi:hypothetical protein CRM22_008439 [Opisthorchis felineus]|uniref:SEA domain-containing protein n=1 Tax=Opisthorchis felineus TaxID=147828 RepID=A0A4S2LB92_OPIFE|nr:hypothetical protein CRM22_008439 [Opisthorchis felineus]
MQFHEDHVRLLFILSVFIASPLAHFETSTTDSISLYIRALVVDKSGASVKLTQQHDKVWSFQHLLIEARLCRFLDRSFERSKVLSSLHFKCKFFGSLNEQAILGVQFRKDQLDQLRPGHNNEMLSQEIAMTARPILHVWGLKEVFVNTENPMTDTENQTTLAPQGSTNSTTFAPTATTPRSNGSRTRNTMYCTVVLLQFVIFQRDYMSAFNNL